MKRTVSVIALFLTFVMLFTSCTQGKVTDTSSSPAAPTTSDVSSSQETADKNKCFLCPDPEHCCECYLYGNCICGQEEPSINDEGEIVVDEDVVYEDVIEFNFAKESPKNKEWVDSLTPTFKWTELKGAKWYSLQVEQYKDGAHYKVLQVDKINGTSYTLKADEALKTNELYRWRVYAVTEDQRYPADMDYNGNLFVSKFDSASHPANKGIDYSMTKDGISEESLNNYLDRSMVMPIFDDLDNMQEYARVILYSGAKLVKNAVADQCWKMNGAELENYPTYKKGIDLIHKYDPDIIFEAGIYECINKSCEEIPIPAYVFEAFGLPVEERNFCFDDIKNLSYEWSGENIFHSAEAGTPDITRLECQMWIYYRATKYIDTGFESLFFGTLGRIVINDFANNLKTTEKVFNMIRDYAKEHSRRGWVLLQANDFGLVQEGENGERISLLDYVTWITCGVAPEGSVAHAPTVDNPQKIILKVDSSASRAIYTHSAKNVKTPSGWIAKALPYGVEFDNSGYNPEQLDKPSFSISSGLMWGIDEVGWFMRQPTNYQREWIEYAYNEIPSMDSVGHWMMPGRKMGTTPTGGVRHYKISNPYWGDQFGMDALDLEETVRNIWIKNCEAKLK